jgi:hypothetical protein
MAAMAFQLVLSWSLRNECKLVYTENFMIFGHSGREFERISSGKCPGKTKLSKRRNSPPEYPGPKKKCGFPVSSYKNLGRVGRF